MSKCSKSSKYSKDRSIQASHSLVSPIRPSLNLGEIYLSAGLPVALKAFRSLAISSLAIGMVLTATSTKVLAQSAPSIINGNLKTSSKKVRTLAQTSGTGGGTTEAQSGGTGTSQVQLPANTDTAETQPSDSDVPSDTLEDSSKAGSAKRAANSASSQNAISALTMPMSANKKWNVYLGVDYTQDTFDYTDRFQEFGLSYYYQLPDSLLFASTSYIAPTTYLATTTERLQLQDSSIGWMKPNFATIKKAKLDIITAVTLPTNEFSRMRGQTVQGFGALDTKFSFLNNGLFIFRVGAQATDFRYNTADRFGRTPNTPFTAITRALVRYTFFQRLLLAASYQYAPSWDFSKTQYDNQSASATATFFLNSQISLSGGWAWGDQFRSNFALFDPSKTQWTLGLSVGI